jgi:hypothetical protein
MLLKKWCRIPQDHALDASLEVQEIHCSPSISCWWKVRLFCDD